MKLEKIESLLLEEFPEDIPNIAEDWKPLFEQLDKHYRKFVTLNFLKTYSGLMLDNSEGAEIKKVYCATFLSKNVIEKVIHKKCLPALLFVHHPMDWEESGVGFVALHKKDYQNLKKNKISVFLAHITLDRHRIFSPSVQLARVLGIKKHELIDTNVCNFVCAKSPVKTFDELKELVKKKLGIRKVQEMKFRDESKKVAIVAGGGDYIEIIDAAYAAGCDTYLTGVFYFRGNEYARRHNPKFIERCRQMKMNMLGASHYLTEKFALLRMVEFFSEKKVSAEFIDENEKIEILNKIFGKRVS